MSRRYRWLCQTPTGYCKGSKTIVAPAMAGRLSHASAEEAFRCYVAYLLSQGYKRVGSREFAPPDGGPVLVLTKKSRYGARLRGGKEGRVMAGGPFNDGVIIG